MNVKSGRQSHSQWQAITRTAESRRSLVASASFLDEGWSVTDDSQIQEKEVGSREGVEEDSLRKLEELAKRGLSADGDARGVGNAANAARRAAAQALARAAEKKAGEESSDEKNVCAEASSGFTLLPEGGFIVTGDEDAQLFSGEGWRESAAPEQGGQGEKFVGEGEDVLMSLLEGWEVDADEGGDASVEDEDDEDDVFRRPGTVMSSGMERELAASEEGERSDSEELEGVQIHPGNTQVSSRDILDTVNFRDDRERVSLQEQTLVGLSMHEIRQLEAAQQVANRVNGEAETRRKRRTGRARRHRKLRIVAGSAAGRRLWSPVDERTRPMMEKVRNGVFSALTSRTAGGGCNLPSGSRWLDCYAGTGALGLEALSRGCSEACFVELDNWVVSEVLSPNIRGCGFEQSAAVHCCAAEEFMQRAHDHPGFAGGAFDFLSICPPYLKVSYPEMLSLLQGSPLMHDGSHLILEYPKRLEHEICDTIGSLVQLRVRKYGRTILVHFGPEP